jgi:hypothetical protein
MGPGGWRSLIQLRWFVTCRGDFCREWRHVEPGRAPGLLASVNPIEIVCYTPGAPSLRLASCGTGQGSWRCWRLSIPLCRRLACTASIGLRPATCYTKWRPSSCWPRGFSATSPRRSTPRRAPGSTAATRCAMFLGTLPWRTETLPGAACRWDPPATLREPLPPLWMRIACPGGLFVAIHGLKGSSEWRWKLARDTGSL